MASWRNCVIAAAYGVDCEYVRMFLSTFRALNQNARVILLVDDRSMLAPAVDEFEVELDVNRWMSRFVPKVRLDRKRQTVRITELIGRTSVFPARISRVLPEFVVEQLISIVLARHFHTRRVLAREHFCQVLLSDSRDVLFQADPFRGDADLELAMEDQVFGRCAFNDKWMRTTFGQETLDALTGKSVYCVGTILGRHRNVEEVIDRICKLVRCARSWRNFGTEQAIFNRVVYNFLSPGDYAISSNRSGRLTTLGPDPSTVLVDGCVVDENGAPFPVVHQYDRLPSATRGQLRALARSDEDSSEADV